MRLMCVLILISGYLGNITHDHRAVLQSLHRVRGTKVLMFSHIALVVISFHCCLIYTCVFLPFLLLQYLGIIFSDMVLFVRWLVLASCCDRAKQFSFRINKA